MTPRRLTVCPRCGDPGEACNCYEDRDAIERALGDDMDPPDDDHDEDPDDGEIDF